MVRSALIRAGKDTVTESHRCGYAISDMKVMQRMKSQNGEITLEKCVGTKNLQPASVLDERSKQKNRNENRKRHATKSANKLPLPFMVTTSTMNVNQKCIFGPPHHMRLVLSLVCVCGNAECPMAERNSEKSMEFYLYRFHWWYFCRCVATCTCTTIIPIFDS